MTKKIGAVLLVLIMALASGLPALPARAASIMYVDAEATGGDNNGTSWADAYTDLQSALALAHAGNEIWVAEGTYKPTDGTNRYATFNLKSGVAIHGGFTANSLDPDERDPQLYETILSGEIQDGNSYHVVTSEGTEGGILDGFTITGGNANLNDTKHRNGGGIWNDGELMVNNCIIDGNTAAFRGGGLFNSGGTVTLNRVTISQNTSTGTLGGTSAGGGGIEVSGIPSARTTVNLINCIMNSNTATTASSGRRAEGGAIRTGGPGTTLNIINSTIVNNTCQSYFSNSIGGGGIRSAITTTIINSILWGNKAGSNLNQILYPHTTTTQVIYSDIDDGIEGWGTITYDHIKTAKPLFVEDGFDLSPNSPCIDAGKNYKDLPETDAKGHPRIVDGNEDGVATVDMGAFEYLTDLQYDTLELIEQVSDLVDSEVLNQGQGNSLIVKLEAAFKKLYANGNTATNQLKAFINQVEDFMNSGILDEDQGQTLINEANVIIEQL